MKNLFLPSWAPEYPFWAILFLRVRVDIRKFMFIAIVTGVNDTSDKTMATIPACLHLTVNS
jgi:hypothetical protein